MKTLVTTHKVRPRTIVVETPLRAAVSIDAGFSESKSLSDYLTRNGIDPRSDFVGRYDAAEGRWKFAQPKEP